MEDMSMDKIMSLAGMLGQNADIGDIMKAVSAAQRINGIMNVEKKETPKEVHKAEVIKEPLISATSGKNTHDLRSRQIEAITKALPFLDREYQRSVFLAVKIMEINSFCPDSGITAMESGEKSINERRLNLIKAFEGYLDLEEKNKMKTIINAMKAGAVIK